MYLCPVMEDTRTRIIQENFKAIHRFGFQGTRTDKVVGDMGITKGAFYHYFPTKSDLGYAILDEVVCPMYTGLWRPFAEAKEKQDELLIETIKKYFQFIDSESVKWGCVLNNLMQEMSPIDEGFRLRLQQITLSLQQSIETGLKNGQLSGVFRTDMNPTQTAFFILACVQGGFSVAKAMQSMAAFELTFQRLVEFAKSLKN